MTTIVMAAIDADAGMVKTHAHTMREASVMAPEVSAMKPPTGFNLVSLEPIVLTILKPPMRVPTPIVVYEMRTTQYGIAKEPLI